MEERGCSQMLKVVPDRRRQERSHGSLKVGTRVKSKKNKNRFEESDKVCTHQIPVSVLIYLTFLLKRQRKDEGERSRK